MAAPNIPSQISRARLGNKSLQIQVVREVEMRGWQGLGSFPPDMAKAVK